MEYLITIVSFIFSLNYMILAIYFIFLLSSKRNTYPFQKCTSLCNLICVSCVVLNQLLYLIMNLLTYYDLLILRQYLLAVHSICLYLFFGIPFLIRALEVSELVRFSYYHLTFKSSNPTIIKDSHEYYLNRLQKPNQDIINARFSLLILFTLSIVLGLGMFFEPFRCSMLNMTSLNEIPYDQCEAASYRFLADIVKITTLTFYIIYTLSIITSIFKYQISHDQFYVKNELIMNLLWIFIQFLSFMYKKKSYFDSLQINSLIDYFYIICQLYLFYIRRQMTKSTYKKILQDYNMFMRNYLAFNHLKEYIANSTHFANSIKLMDFWQEYYLYKVHTMKSNILKKSDLIIHAYILYNDYFKQDYEDSAIAINKDINIPMDIVDEIEEASKAGFCISRKDLGKVFDAAFKLVNDKLYNLYYDMMKHEDEKDKLVSLFTYSEFDELKEELTKL